jgi:uncharacterized protein
MKILAVTDAVDQVVYSGLVKHRFGDIDCVIACGDLPPYYLEFLVSMLDVPVYYVRGNHDGELMERDGDGRAQPPGGCTLLEDRVIDHDGLLLAGLGGSPRYNGKSDQYTDFEQQLRILKLAPRLWLNQRRYGRALDILVTHAPPRGINDQPDPCHLGFPSFLRFLDRYRPRYMLHGHIHLYNRNARHITRYGETEVINVYPYRVLEIDVGGEKGAAHASGRVGGDHPPSDR